MGLERLSSEFETRVREVMNDQELAAILGDAANELGFAHYAVVHSVSFRRDDPSFISIDNYPESWAEEFVGQRLYLDDPVHAACARTPSGLSWDRIGEFIAPSPRQISILEKGRAHGLKAGFTMPIRMTDEPDAVFTAARDTDAELSSEDVLTARLIGTVAFDRARAILGEDRIVFEPVALSPRQIDCIALVAQGKSDWEIAQILGLSRDTVHEYVEAARSIGASRFHVMIREIMPNVLSPVIVVATVRIAHVIILEASLSFLGLGVQPPTPSWGVMLADAQSYLSSAPRLAVYPGLAIFFCALAYNLLGDGLRDVLDPRTTR